MEYFDNDQMVDVSVYDEDGYWVRNDAVQVQRGLSLPARCTPDIITPSDGQTARFCDGTWGDFLSDDRGKTVYLKKSGEAYVCQNIGESESSEVVDIAPPVFDTATHFARYVDEAWCVKEILIGRKYFDANGQTFVVHEYDFVLPTGHLFQKPPASGTHECLRVVDGEWTIVPDYMGVVYWLPEGTKCVCKSTGVDLPDGVLLEPPPDATYLTHDGVAWIRDLDVFKSVCFDHVQTNKSHAKDGGFVVPMDGDDVLFDSDANAQTAYLMFATALNQDPTYNVEWKASKGVWVTMDAPLFAKVSTGLSAHFSACFAWQKAKEDAINACTTEEELNAIPLVYGE